MEINLKHQITNETKAAFDAILNRIDQLEKIHQLKITLLEDCIKAGNDLFDFFVDDVINEKDSKDMSISINQLELYLTTVMATRFAPHSMNMSIIYEDKLLRN